MSFATRLRAARLFREAQQLSAADGQAKAGKLLHEAGRLDPSLPHLALQAAMVEARAGQPREAIRKLAEAGRDDPPYLLFRGFFEARAGQLSDALVHLDTVLAAAPHNRVAATARAYALLKAARPHEALSIVKDGAGDNHEILSWCWLELERLAQSLPAPQPPTPPATPLPVPANARGARRFYTSGIAAAQDNTNFAWRRKGLAAARRDRPPLLARLLRPLLETLERRWPTDALAAFLAVRAAGATFPELPLQLGAQLYHAGYPAAALPELETACEAMADSPEVYLPQLYRATCLIELRRWDEAAEALAAVAEAEAVDESESAGATHEFGQPFWHAARARVRLARGNEAGAVADLQKALSGEPAIFDERITELVGTLQSVLPPDQTATDRSRRR